MAVRLGGDYSFARPSVSSLKSLGITFVSRYVSPESSKNLTLSEAQALSAGGIDIVTNWENTANDSTGGYNAGVSNARNAWAQHKACGGPNGRPVYFSIDTDLSPTDGNLTAYFQGIVSVLGAAGTGVYGSTAVCQALKSAGLVHWTWRTMSTGWRGGAGTMSMFNVEQTGYINSSIDRDASITDDFGQWRIGVVPSPVPIPTPVPSGTPSVSLAVVQMCANNDPAAPQGSTTNFGNVYPVQRALVAEGFLSDTNHLWGRGAWGTMTLAAYSAWQHKLGYAGSNADGHPGMTSLSKLGAAHGFTVTA